VPRASSPLPLLVTLTTLALAAALAPIGRAQDEAPRARCSRALDRSVLDRSLGLGTGYMLRAQRAEGNFTYAYDWHSGREVGDDSQVRQAGASWGLGLIFASERQPQVGTALTRSLGFFRRHSRGGGNARWIAYPGATQGSLGTVALVALAHVERLRALGASTPAARELLDGYLGTVLAARRPDGLFHGSYRLDDGIPFGAPSPYFDGEALLALVKAARYGGRRDLLQAAILAADRGHQLNVVDARATDPDSPRTKGYYQWASLAYYELATWSGVGLDSDRYSGWLFDLADWMVDVHRTLERARNTGYAHEGLIPAFALARARGDRARADRLGCVIQRGLERLTSWQVGSPLENSFIRARPADPRALGGAQNHASEPLLRIDVAQHQMHAVLLARQHGVVAPVGP
jgi:UDP-N-acetylmuramoyl-tripeptide--D-alanyl-D-alanine ligase